MNIGSQVAQDARLKEGFVRLGIEALRADLTTTEQPGDTPPRYCIPRGSLSRVDFSRGSFAVGRAVLVTPSY